jgi:hypothetical protein
LEPKTRQNADTPVSQSRESVHAAQPYDSEGANPKADRPASRCSGCQHLIHPNYESKRTRQAGVIAACSCCSRQWASPLSAFLTCGVTAGGMTKRMTAAAPNRQIGSLVLCVGLVGSRRICLLTLGASSIQTGRDGSRRIVWMIKQGSLLGRAPPTTASEELSRACSSSLLVLDDHRGRG